MPTGIEELLISGGAEFIIARLAAQVSDETLPVIKAHLRGDHTEDGLPDIKGARKAAREQQVAAEFRNAIEQFEQQSGVKVESYSMEYTTEDAGEETD